jgi:hypothetical protein
MNYLLTVRNLKQNTIINDFNFIKEKIKKKDEIWSFQESFKPIDEQLHMESGN